MLIGIDLGGSSVKAGLVDGGGKMVKRNARPTDTQKGYKYVIDGIARQAEDLAAGMGGISSVGIGVPGVADAKTGRVLRCANLEWTAVDLGGELETRLKKNVHIENDANAAALGESLFGATKGAANSVLLTLGTGIGSGIILNGRVFGGSHALGAEIGHTIVGQNFYGCNCGNNGCLETFASATAVVKYVAHRLGEGAKSALIGGEITSKAVFDAAKRGDPLAMEAADRLMRYLAVGIVNICNTLDPDIIALGGGVSNAGDFLLSGVKKKLAGMLLVKNAKYAEITLAALGNDAGIIGAAFLGRQNRIQK